MVTAIMGILMAIGLPGFRTLMDTQKMKSATFELITTVMQARSEAIKFGAGASSASSGISIRAKGDDFNNGWCIVFSSSSTCTFPNPTSLTPAPGPDVMRINAPVANVAYSVITCSSTPCIITFGRNGRLKSGTAVKIQVVNDLASSPLTRCVTIEAAGNAKATVGACS
ncbi:MAG: GspH/FimT family pseudopilin [Sulfuritalea sp.]|nr:GspH/FimT family pseudopilin [Sulfuritalea sp.]